tara:strand:+ start:2107 stop:2211 length:105 start_codon:yes stop_codon:yes gene_type:complete
MIKHKTPPGMHTGGVFRWDGKSDDQIAVARLASM